jgi:hypothetical protein
MQSTPSKNVTRLVAFGVVLLLLGLLFVGASVVGYIQGANTKADPQQLTLQQLADNGYGDNAHVLLTDFRFADTFVYEKKDYGDFWEKAWIPLVPADAEEDPASFRVVLETDDVHGDSNIEELAQQPKVQGVIWFFDSLDSETQGLLESDFPETDFAKCLIVKQVELGEKQMPAATSLCCLVPGGLLLLVGAAITILAARR